MGCGDSKPETERKENGLSESLVSNNAPNPAAAPSSASKIHTDAAKDGDNTSLLSSADASAAAAGLAPAAAPAAKAPAAVKAPVAAPAPAPAPAPVATGLETKWGKLNNNVTNGRKLQSWSEEAAAGDHAHFDWPKNKKGKSFHNYVLTCTGKGAFALSMEGGEKCTEGGIDAVLSHMGAKK